MGISPIIEIQRVGLVKGEPPEAESVAPPFGPEGSKRTDDDFYVTAHEQAERGLEEDHAGADESNEASEEGSAALGGGGSVSFFA